MRVEIPNQISVKIGGIISRGVKAVEVSDEGKLIFTLTDGSTVDLGSVIGPAGPKGETGPAGPTGPAGAKGDTGAAGASILSIEKTAQSGTTSTYTITMSDGQTFEFEVQSDKGEKGDKGDTGAQGPKGPQGEQGPAGIVVQETEPTGPEHPVWVNPKGGASDPGITGKDGTTFTPSVSASGDLSWTNDGGKANPETVNIRGPQGETGPQGPTGPAGPDGTPGKDGKDGSPGATPNLQIGTVTTLPAGSDATASMGGTAENPLLNLGIPKGADGSGGSGATDLSLGMTSAAVGQIAKITAVDADGKPTAWSPVDMPSGGDTWELIGTISLGEATVDQLDFDYLKKIKIEMGASDSAATERFNVKTDVVYRTITVNATKYASDNWVSLDNRKFGAVNHPNGAHTLIYIDCDATMILIAGPQVSGGTGTPGFGVIKNVPSSIYRSDRIKGIRVNTIVTDGTENTASGTIKIWGVKA